MFSDNLNQHFFFLNGTARFENQELIVPPSAKQFFQKMDAGLHLFHPRAKPVRILFYNSRVFRPAALIDTRVHNGYGVI